MGKIKKKDLIINNYYAVGIHDNEYEWIIKISGFGVKDKDLIYGPAIIIKERDYYSDDINYRGDSDYGGWGYISDIVYMRPANIKEVAHLNECIKKNRWVASKNIKVVNNYEIY